MKQEILRLIIQKSPDAFREASKTIQAINANSPIIDRRLNIVADLALNDPQADFNQEERGQIASIMTVIDSDQETRSKILQARVSEAELVEVQMLAEDAGLKLSDYIRRELGL